jgi:tetratricopeptide (TPR) repeat protein
MGISGVKRPSIEESPSTSPVKTVSASSPLSPPDSPGTKKIPVGIVMRLLLNFASFLSRARGDIEGAFIVYRKAYRIDETDPKVLAHFAHFLAEEGGDLMNSPTKNAAGTSHVSTSEAERLFALALKSNPKDAMIAIWYAKLLKKSGKLGQVNRYHRII